MFMCLFSSLDPWAGRDLGVLGSGGAGRRGQGRAPEATPQRIWRAALGVCVHPPVCTPRFEYMAPKILRILGVSQTVFGFFQDFLGPPGAGDGPKMCAQEPAFEPQSMVRIRPMAARLVAKMRFEKKRKSQLLFTGPRSNCSVHFLMANDSSAGKTKNGSILLPSGLNNWRPK